MNIILFPFNLFSNLLGNMFIPIKLSDTVIFNLNLFFVFVISCILSVIFYVLCKVMDIEFNTLFKRQVNKLDKKIFPEKPVVSKQNGFIVKKTNFR